MEGQQIRGNGGTKEDAPQNLGKGPHVGLSEEEGPGGGRPGVSRPHGSAEHGQHPGQMHFDVECPLLYLIIFHSCILRELTSRTIKGASLPPHNTHHFSCEGEK